MDKTLLMVFSAFLFCSNGDAQQGNLQSPQRTTQITDLVKSQEILEDMAARITKESKTLGNDHWAGRYDRGGSGLSGSAPEVNLLISPKSGFVCMSPTPDIPELSFIGYGYVHQEKNGIVLVFTAQNDQLLPHSLRGGALVPVSWGKRKYLIGEDNLLSFCNAINSGEEHRYSARGDFLLRRDGDQMADVRGFPSVPEKFRPYLLERPIVAKVVSVNESPKVLADDGVHKGPEMTLAIGENGGVRVGMQLYVRDIDYVVSRVEVVASDDDTCIVRFRPFWENSAYVLPSPKIGWSLSTVSELGEGETILKERRDRVSEHEKGTLLINGFGRWSSGAAKAVFKPQAGGSLPYPGFMPEGAVSPHAGSERSPG